jgi:hypothetical protein
MRFEALLSFLKTCKYFLKLTSDIRVIWWTCHLRNVIVQKLKYKTYNIRCSHLNTLGLRLPYFHKLESSICNTSVQSANLATPYISATVVGIVRQ